MIRLETKNYGMILTEKQPKYQLHHQLKYLTGEDILPSNQQQIIEQARFTYSPLVKAFEKQTKIIEDKEQKQIDAIESLKPKEQRKRLKINLIISQKPKLYLMTLLTKEKK